MDEGRPERRRWKDERMEDNTAYRTDGYHEDELREARANVSGLFEDSEDLEPDNPGYWESESRRVIDEVNQLMRRFETATRGPRAAPRTASAPRYTTPPKSHCSCGANSAKGSSTPELKPDFFKKMFMFMMTELA